MQKRQPRPGGLKQEKPVHNIERADTIIARAAQGGPEHHARDIEAWRQEFLAEKLEGKPSTFWAFMAVSTVAARDAEELDRTREIVGLPPVKNYATEVPHRMVEIPVWAVVALWKGWMRATVGEVRDGETAPGPPQPLPLSDAFGLAGEGGSRTVGRHHLQAWRDRKLALEVERHLAQNPGMKAHRAHADVAEMRGGITVKTVERAHAKWGELARTRLPSST